MKTNLSFWPENLLQVFTAFEAVRNQFRMMTGAKTSLRKMKDSLYLLREPQGFPEFLNDLLFVVLI